MLRLLILSDDPLARSGLAAMLSTQPDLTIAAQMATDAEVAEALDVYAPDAILWDFGAEAALSVVRAKELERTPIVALVIDAGDAGAVWGGAIRGVLPRDASGEQIAAALESVSRGLFVLDPAFDSLLAPSRTDRGGALAESLTPRETEVLQLLARGLANKAIAQELEISEHTVKFHVNSILAKLSAQSRTDAVVRATRLGLITL